MKKEVKLPTGDTKEVFVSPATVVHIGYEYALLIGDSVVRFKDQQDSWLYAQIIADALNKAE